MWQFYCVTTTHVAMTIKTSIYNYDQYVHLLTKDQRRVLRANKSVANQIVNASINHQRTFRCTVCGNLILDFHGYFNRVTCSPVCMTEGKKSMLGLKRPEHSARMKTWTKEAIADGRLWNAAHRENNRKHLKTVNASENLSSSARSARLTSDESRRVRLLRFVNGNSELKQSKYFKNSPLSELTPQKISKASSSRLVKLITDYNSVKSLVAMDNNPNMGNTAFYKRTVVKHLKRNSTRKTVTVRSGDEYNFVMWLERESVRWVYEWVTIRYRDTHRYTPDFKVQLQNGDVWVVESKGFYTQLSFPKERAKMITAAAWARYRGYRFTVLNGHAHGKRGLTVDPASWVDLTTMTDKQITNYMKTHIPGGNSC